MEVVRRNPQVQGIRLSARTSRRTCRAAPRHVYEGQVALCPAWKMCSTSQRGDGVNHCPRRCLPTLCGDGGEAGSAREHDPCATGAAHTGTDASGVEQLSRRSPHRPRLHVLMRHARACRRSPALPCRALSGQYPPWTAMTQLRGHAARGGCDGSGSSWCLAFREYLSGSSLELFRCDFRRTAVSRATAGRRPQQREVAAPMLLRRGGRSATAAPRRPDHHAA